MRALRVASRSPGLWVFTLVALGAAGGCAGILGLDEVTESTGEAGDDAGSETGTVPDEDGATDSGSKTDVATDGGGGDAPSDASTDADADADAARVDAGCNQTIATDFTSVALPAQVTEVADGLATIAYDNTGVGGTRAMHATVPVGAKGAELVVNLTSLGTDGAKKCAVTCSVDVKLLQRGVSAQVKLLTVEPTAGNATFAALIHTNTSTYFARSGMGLEPPDLGTTGNGVFTTLSIDVTGAVAPFTGTGALGATTSAKTLTFFPTSARIGIAKVDTDPIVEAIFDNLSCKAHN